MQAKNSADALVCTGLHWFALVCIGLHWFASVENYRAKLHQRTRTCSKVNVNYFCFDSSRCKTSRPGAFEVKHKG